MAEILCSICLDVKDEMFFHRTKSGKHGRSNACMDCKTQKAFIRNATAYDVYAIANRLMETKVILPTTVNRFIVTSNFKEQIKKQSEVRKEDEKYLFEPFTVKPKQEDYQKTVKLKKHWAA